MFRPMKTTVTSKNMISIPVEIARKFAIKPGFTFDWAPSNNPEEIVVKVIPDRAGLSRRLKGGGRKYSPDRDSVAELLAERLEDAS